MAKIKKAQDGTGLTKKYKPAEIRDNSIGVAKSRPTKSGGTKDKAIGYKIGGFAPTNARVMKQKTDAEGNVIKSKERPISVKKAAKRIVRKVGEFEFEKGGKLTKAKAGKQMLKRADGSVSQRGLWDNIRAAAKKNKAAGKPGKKPTAAMLKQERKIKAKSK